MPSEEYRMNLANLKPILEMWKRPSPSDWQLLSFLQQNNITISQYSIKKANFLRTKIYAFNSYFFNTLSDKSIVNIQIHENAFRSNNRSDVIIVCSESSFHINEKWITQKYFTNVVSKQLFQFSPIAQRWITGKTKKQTTQSKNIAIRWTEASKTEHPKRCFVSLHNVKLTSFLRGTQLFLPL